VNRREQQPIKLDRAGLMIELVLVPAPLRDLDHTEQAVTHGKSILAATVVGRGPTPSSLLLQLGLDRYLDPAQGL